MDITDLLHRLGDLPLERLVLPPAPGTATVEDLIAAGKPAHELVERTLVSRPPDFLVASSVPFLLGKLFLMAQESNLGVVTNAIAPIKTLPGTVRAPDIAYTSWSRLPNRRLPTEPIASVIPDLVVNYWRMGNTRAEMARKRGEYSRSGVRLLWEVDPRARTVRVYTSETEFTDPTTVDTLDGGVVLPGFTLPLTQLFAELDRHG